MRCGREEGYDVFWCPLPLRARFLEVLLCPSWWATLHVSLRQPSPMTEGLWAGPSPDISPAQRACLPLCLCAPPAHTVQPQCLPYLTSDPAGPSLLLQTSLPGISPISLGASPRPFSLPSPRPEAPRAAVCSARGRPVRWLQAWTPSEPGQLRMPPAPAVKVSEPASPFTTRRY